MKPVYAKTMLKPRPFAGFESPPARSGRAGIRDRLVYSSWTPSVRAAYRFFLTSPRRRLEFRP